jgi:predicted ABC-type ATPase
LNGQQITGLIGILEQYNKGLIDAAAAEAMITAAFPSIPVEKVRAFIAGTSTKKVEEEPSQEEPPQPAALQEEAPQEEAPQEEAPQEEAPQPVEAASEELRNCGTGKGGFKSGNKCAKGGKGVVPVAGGGGGGGAEGKAGDAGEEADKKKPAGAKAAAKKKSAGKPADKDSKKKAGGGGVSDEEYAELKKSREAKAEARRPEDYEKARPNGIDSLEQFTTADGKWTPQRKALHDEIIKDATAGVDSKERPTLNMMGGGPAAGKSSIVRSGDVTLPKKHVVANPDEFKEDLPEYRAGTKAGDNKIAAFMHEESSYLNKEVMKASAAAKLDTVWDGTGDSSVEKIRKQTEMYRKQGFKIVADYVTVDTEVAVERAAARAKKTGREVPEAAIRQTHAKVSQIWPIAARRGYFDESNLWDTGEGGKPIKIASVKGKKITVHNKARYAKFLSKATEKWWKKTSGPRDGDGDGIVNEDQKRSAKPTRRSLLAAPENRNCGTGNGGFKSGNKCAKGGAGVVPAGGGGGGDPVDDIDHQAGRYEDYTLADAHSLNKKKLDSLRKKIIKDADKNNAEIKEKMMERSAAKLKIEEIGDIRSRLFASTSKLEEKLASSGISDAERKSLESQLETNRISRKVVVNEFSSAARKYNEANSQLEAARQKARGAAFEALKKESRAVDREDGITAADRKASDASFQFVKETGATIVMDDAGKTAKSGNAAEERAAAFESLGIVNKSIHSEALAARIQYHDDPTYRANATGRVAISGDLGIAEAGVVSLSTSTGRSTVVHEFGHQLEKGNAEVAKLADDFLQKRVAGSPEINMRDTFGSRYSSDEIGREDDFAKAFKAVQFSSSDEAGNLAAYAGKKYQHQGQDTGTGFKYYGSTEVLSMGLELITKDPVAFAKADPEWFDFTAGVVTGRTLRKTRGTRRFAVSSGRKPKPPAIPGVTKKKNKWVDKDGIVYDVLTPGEPQ